MNYTNRDETLNKMIEDLQENMKELKHNVSNQTKLLQDFENINRETIVIEQENNFNTINFNN
jgi:hypothetical protein